MTVAFGARKKKKQELQLICKLDDAIFFFQLQRQRSSVSLSSMSALSSSSALSSLHTSSSSNQDLTQIQTRYLLRHCCLTPPLHPFPVWCPAAMAQEITYLEFESSPGQMNCQYLVMTIRMNYSKLTLMREKLMTFAFGARSKRNKNFTQFVHIVVIR